MTDGSRGIPSDARVFTLRPRSKKPLSGTRGHHDAIPLPEYIDLGANIGIALDGQFLVVDFDREHSMRSRWEHELPPTWSQRSPGGVHRLYRVPEGWHAKNVKIAPDDGETAAIGDVKVHGYIVGPESYVEADRGRPAGTYTLLDGREPVPAPQWLLDYVQQSQPAATVSERTGVPYGSHDDFLVSAAGWLRERYGLAEDTLRDVLPGLLPALDGYDEAHPYTGHDYARIARSVGHYAPGIDTGNLVGEMFRSGADVSLVGPPERWWIPGQVPNGALTMIYAPGGVGKSTWGSYVAREITRQEGIIAAACVEEPFRRYLRRAVLDGADRARMYEIVDAERLQFPRDADLLKKQLRLLGASAVYFDSIASHMDAEQGLNIAERTRRSLAPLAAMAQLLDVAVVCVFHTNKAGDFGGSVEMVNVARHVLSAQRRPGSPMHVRVRKTNLEDPGVVYQFGTQEVAVIEPTTGEVQQRRIGRDLVPVYERVAVPMESISIEEADAAEDAETVVTGPPRGKRLAVEIEGLLKADPAMTAEEMANALGVPLATLKRYLAPVRRKLHEEEAV